MGAPRRFPGLRSYPGASILSTSPAARTCRLASIKSAIFSARSPVAASPLSNCLPLTSVSTRVNVLVPKFKQRLCRNSNCYQGFKSLSVNLPAFVIRIHRDFILRPPIQTSSIVEDANPARAMLTSVSARTPCSISAASALPPGPASANILRTRRHSALSGIFSIAIGPLSGGDL